MARQQTRIKREDVMTLCRLGPRQAKHKLDYMVATGLLVRQGLKRGTYYTIASNDVQTGPQGNGT